MKRIYFVILSVFCLLATRVFADEDGKVIASGVVRNPSGGIISCIVQNIGEKPISGEIILTAGDTPTARATFPPREQFELSGLNTGTPAPSNPNVSCIVTLTEGKLTDVRANIFITLNGIPVVTTPLR